MDIGLTMISQAISFSIFIWFTVKFVWPPLLTAITERQHKIEEGLAAAERSKKDLELAQAHSTDALKEAREKSSKMLRWHGPTQKPRFASRATASSSMHGCQR